MNEKKGFLIILILIFGTIVSLMLKPFLAYILGAMILAFALRRPHRFLRKRIGDRPSAFVMTVSSVLLAVIPFILLGVAVADDARDVVKEINTTDVVDIEGIEKAIKDFTGQELDLESNLASAIKTFSSTTVGGFTEAVNFVANLVIGLSIMLFLMYYLLKDGESLISWGREFSPLPQEIDDQMLTQLSKTTSGVMKGHILVAIAQGILAGIGLALFGIENFLFWTFIMVILGVLPIIGSMIVWLPASIYLVISVDPLNGIMLALYGFIVVGLSDNFLRPFFVDESADLHPAVVIMGVIGGVSVFGAPGLFIGPIAFGIFKTTANVFIKHFDNL